PSLDLSSFPTRRSSDLFAFWPRAARHVAGGVLLAFQVSLILSGNLSFLNWLTIVPILACFDDSLLRRMLPGSLVARAERAAAAADRKSTRLNSSHQIIS